MYGLGDAMREDTGNLHKLDDMVTVAKKALTAITEITGESMDLKMMHIKAIALQALLKIEHKGR